MNKDRRKKIAEALEAMETARGILEGVQEEERDSYENLPEGLQASERGEAMEEAAERLEEAIGSIEEIAVELEEL